MTKIRDITSEVIVPRPVKRIQNDESFFIGQVPMDTPPETIDIEVAGKQPIKQPHLDYSESTDIDTRWKSIKDIY